MEAFRKPQPNIRLAAEIEEPARERIAASSVEGPRPRQWMHRVISLIEAAVVQLGDEEHRAHIALSEAALLLRQQFYTSNVVDSAAVGYRALSSRESSILRMIAHGMSNKRIAQSLGIAPETVKSHAKNIFVKLSTRTRAQAVARAESMGFL
jgi:LuxR family transcriptional regulator, maltose regulon positive regulatory protein